jgi:hypothetical protein
VAHEQNRAAVDAAGLCDTMRSVPVEQFPNIAYFVMVLCVFLLFCANVLLACAKNCGHASPRTGA